MKNILLSALNENMHNLFSVMSKNIVDLLSSLNK